MPSSRLRQLLLTAGAQLLLLTAPARGLQGFAPATVALRSPPNHDTRRKYGTASTIARSMSPGNGNGEGGGGGKDSPPAAVAPSLLLPSLVLTPAAASCAAEAALKLARAEGWAVTVCVSDAGGVPLFALRDGGGNGPPAFAASYEIAVGKARSAAMFGKDTSALEGAANVKPGEGGGGAVGRTALLSAPFVVMGGGVPVKTKGGITVGAVGVSGVRPDQDEAVARAGAEALEEIIASASRL